MNVAQAENGKVEPATPVVVPPSSPVVPPLLGEIHDVPTSWIESVGRTLLRFPGRHFAVTVTVLALFGIAVFILKAGNDLTPLAVWGALAVAVLIAVTGMVAFFASRNDAPTEEK